MKDAVLSQFSECIKALGDEVITVHLFGSRARGDNVPSSDYDILLVVTRKTPQLIDQLYDGVMDILLSTGKLVSLKIFTQAEFERLSNIPTPFMHNVLTDGVKIE